MKTSRLGRKQKQIFLILAAGLTTLLGYTNCSGGFSGISSSSFISASSITGAAQLQMSLQIKDSSGAVVYDDSNPNASLVLKAGQSYTFVVSSNGAQPAGTVLNLKLTNISVIGGQAQTLPLQFGSNTISSSQFVQGNYSLEFDANASSGSQVAKIYNAAVSCANPSFTTASLDASQLTVSSAGSNNLFNFSAANVTSHADGMAPYQCAVDPTGTSILDTGFQPCSQVFASIYSNYVGLRNVGLVVRDACNIAHSVSYPLTLPEAVPAMGQANVFISGQTSGSAGAAVGDKRVDNVTYLATNQPYHTDVQSALGSGSFTIQSSQNYNQASSVNFGIKIVLAGVQGSVTPSSLSGTVSVANATIQSVAYSTDESGDSQVATSYAGSSCVLSNQHSQVKFVTGTPCTTAGGGDQNSATVEVWGHYKCSSLANANGSFALEGDFDGISQQSDSCIGGGGSSGGGIVPISL